VKIEQMNARQFGQHLRRLGEKMQSKDVVWEELPGGRAKRVTPSRATKKRINDGLKRVRFHILHEVDDERMRQDRQWGGIKHDDKHTPADWVLFIIAHANKAIRHDNYRERMLKVAALAVAAVESYDRKANKR
jgi:hypothetical protein